MRARKSSPCLIKKDASSGINIKNKNMLTKLHNDYTIPFHQKNTETASKQMQSINYIKILRDFKPFLSKKKSSTYFINNIALMSLAGMERMMNIEMENNSLKAYIKMLEDEKKQAINGDINTNIDVNVSFSMEYLYYIEKYGIPLDGIFDPVKLAEFV
jgi:hypothetical protein